MRNVGRRHKRADGTSGRGGWQINRGPNSIAGDTPTLQIAPKGKEMRKRMKRFEEEEGRKGGEIVKV